MLCKMEMLISLANTKCMVFLSAKGRSPVRMIIFPKSSEFLVSGASLQDPYTAAESLGKVRA